MLNHKFENQKGLTPIVLLFIAAIGLVVFFVIASATPFKDNLFDRLFPKPPSEASETTNLLINGDFEGLSSPTPTVQPTATPTTRPTASPTVIPTPTPTVTPTPSPSVRPSPSPVPSPSVVQNLLINGNFENSNHLSNWICQGTGSGTCTISNSTDRVGSPYTIEINPRGEAWGRQVAQKDIITTSGSNEAFCLSGYVYKTNPANAVLAIQSPVNYRQIEIGTAGGVRSWALIKQTVTKPAAWSGDKLQVFARSYTPNVKVYFDDISLTRGACR